MSDIQQQQLVSVHSLTTAPQITEAVYALSRTKTFSTQLDII